MNETDYLKICKCIEKLWNSVLMPQQRCAFVYKHDCIGHVVYLKNSGLENAIKIVKSSMHFNSAAEYFNYMKDWFMQYKDWYMQHVPSNQSLFGKLFTMPVEQLMVLADMHAVE